MEQAICYADSSSLEILLAQKEFHENFTVQEIDTLNEVALANYEKDCANPDVEAPAMFFRTLYENQPQTRAGFQYPTTSGGGYLYTNLGSTPKGSRIELIIRKDMTANEKTTLYNYCKSVYPNVTLVGNATYLYNCHSYAYVNASGSSTSGWFNYPSIYWNDGSYISVPSSSLRLDDRVYFSSDHSAILKAIPTSGQSYTSVTVISKWAQGPLLRHKMADCPYATYGVSYSFRRAA